MLRFRRLPRMPNRFRPSPCRIRRRRRLCRSSGASLRPRYLRQTLMSALRSIPLRLLRTNVLRRSPGLGARRRTPFASMHRMRPGSRTFGLARRDPAATRNAARASRARIRISLPDDGPDRDRPETPRGVGGNESKWQHNRNAHRATSSNSRPTSLSPSP